MAVPTGEYDLVASVDLSPLFGVLETESKVSLTRPGAEVLDQRLKELASDDPNVRRRALYDLRYFPKEGERIVPELVKALSDGDEHVRGAALSVFYAFPDAAREQVDLVLGIVTGDGSESERGRAAYFVARFAPEDPKVEKALIDAVESAEGPVKRRLQGALDYYRRMHPKKEPEKSGS
ncbi:MAG: HEAT repeat domain-containing protein [Planctomycetota bacterium]